MFDTSFKDFIKSTDFRMCTTRQNPFIFNVSGLFFYSGPFIYSSDAVIYRKSERGFEPKVWLKAALVDRGDASKPASVSIGDEVIRKPVRNVNFQKAVLERCENIESVWSENASRRLLGGKARRWRSLHTRRPAAESL